MKFKPMFYKLNEKRKSYYHQIVAAFISVSIIEIIIIFSMSVNITSDIIYTKEEQDLCLTANNVSMVVEKKINNIYNTLTTMSHDSTLHKNISEMSIADIQFLTNDFFKKYLHNTELTKISVFFEKDNKVATSHNGIYSLDFTPTPPWIEKYLKNKPIRAKIFSIPSGNSDSEFTFVCGFPSTYLPENGAVAVHVESESLFSNENLSLSDDYSIIITDENNNCIYGNSELYNIIMKNDNMLDNKLYKSSRGGDSFFYVINTNSNNYNKIILLKKATNYFTYRNSNYLKFVIFSLITLLIGTFISFGAAFKLNLPIRQLLNITGFNKTTQKNSKYEFDHLQSFIQNLTQVNEKLNESHIQYRPDILQSVFVKLSTGESEQALETLVSLLAEAKTTTPITQNTRFFVLAIDISLFEQKLHLSRIKENIDENTYTMFIHLSESHMIVLTFILNENFLMKQYLQAIYNDLHNLFETDLIIGVGKTYDNLSKFNLSFSEAISALNFPVKSEKIVFADFCVKPEEITDDAEILALYANITDNLSALDADKFNESISYICDLYTNKHPYSISDTHIWSIMNLMYLYLQSNNSFQYLSATSIFDDYCHFAELKTLDEKILFVKNKVNSIIDEYKKKQNYFYNFLTVTLKEYIENNYESPECSLKEISTTLSLSKSYISDIFSKTAETSFNAYLRNYRLEKARELLKTTNYTIDKISTLVGYTNTRSFLRAFKADTGLTPTEYRQN